MHIVFVIPSLGPGGAERVASLLCNFWTTQDHHVDLVTFEAPGAEAFHALGSRLTLHQLEAVNGVHGFVSTVATNVRRISRLHSLLRRLRPDVIIAFMTEANVITLWASRRLGVPVVISERNQPERPGLGRAHRLARRLSYSMADTMVVQTEPIAAWARARFRVPVCVIPNPVLLARTASQEFHQYRGADGDVHRLISLGRLAHQKGFDILLRSFAALASKHQNWNLIIYGEGPDRAVLERLRMESGLEERISLPGLTKDSARALHEASLFALPSRFEGYPNVLLEALGCGLPVIATASPGGTVEILANGVHGMLAPPDDVSAMTTALDEMMSASDLRQSYSLRAREAVAHLDVEVVGKRWLDLLTGLKS